MLTGRNFQLTEWLSKRSDTLNHLDIRTGNKTLDIVVLIKVYKSHEPHLFICIHLSIINNTRELMLCHYGTNKRVAASVINAWKRSQYTCSQIVSSIWRQMKYQINSAMEWTKAYLCSFEETSFKREKFFSKDFGTRSYDFITSSNDFQYSFNCFQSFKRH